MHKIYILFKEYLISGNLYRATKNFNEHHKVESIWTLVPAIVLIFLAIPSINYSYKSDMFVNFDHNVDGITVKVIGAQWPWFYEFNQISSEYYKEFEDSMDVMERVASVLSGNEKVLANIIIKDAYKAYPWNLPVEQESILSNIINSDLNSGQLRLLETTQPLYSPVHTPIRFLITSRDVLHCFAIPSLGIKLDACPGRLNQVFTIINREGIFYGQCSELCGVNHAFMPIQLVGVSVNPLNEIKFTASDSECMDIEWWIDHFSEFIPFISDLDNKDIEVLVGLLLEYFFPTLDSDLTDEEAYKLMDELQESFRRKR